MFRKVIILVQKLFGVSHIRTGTADGIGFRSQKKKVPRSSIRNTAVLHIPQFRDAASPAGRARRLDPDPTESRSGS
jgi:hypothetical protein